MEKQHLSSRWIIMHDWKILLVKHKWRPYYSLPWWKPEWKESIKEALKRELNEELWINWEIWELLFVNEFLFNWEKNSIDFILKVDNWEKFYKSKINFPEEELDEVYWKNLDEDFEMKPSYLKNELRKMEKKWTKYFSDR